MESGRLEETSSFDGKRELPTKRRNIDIAIDIAAMSTEGGSLIYGIDEDQDERLTRLAPIVLAGASDRISQVVATSVSEVPRIEIREHPRPSDPETGYVSVLVPQSARAPHQVTVGDDKRFYGRAAKGNRRLGEAEVARLYRRRIDWEQDGDALLAAAIEESRFLPHVDLGYAHGFVRPVAPDRRIYAEAVRAAGGASELRQNLRASADDVSGRRPIPSGAALNWRRRGADEWLFSTLPDADAREDPDLADQALDIRLNVDGRGHLFFGRAGARANGGMIVIMEPEIASSLAMFIALLGRLYELGDFHGQVDLGLGLTNVRDGVTSQGSGWLSLRERESYMADTYTRTIRLPAGELTRARGVAADLLLDFFEVTTREPDFDPFAA